MTDREKEQEGLADMTFEKAMERLEGVVKELEAGDVSLEELIEKYELGCKLSKKCSDLLTRATQRIEQISEVSEGGIKVSDYP